MEDQDRPQLKGEEDSNGEEDKGEEETREAADAEPDVETAAVRADDRL